MRTVHEMADAIERASVTCSHGPSPAITYLTRATPSDVVACVTAFALERRVAPNLVAVSIAWPDGINDNF